MPKMKVHKGLKKRVKVTAKGKVRHKKAFAGHLMSGKNGKRRRSLKKASYARSDNQNRFKEALGL